MNKIVAFSILGMGLTGAVLIVSIAFLFNSPVGLGLQMLLAGSTVAFVIFTISAIKFRRRLNETRE